PLTAYWTYVHLWSQSVTANNELPIASGVVAGASYVCSYPALIPHKVWQRAWGCFSRRCTMGSPNMVRLSTLVANVDLLSGSELIGWAVIALLAAALIAAFTCVRFIPNNRVGIVEKLWGPRSLAGGHLIALDGEAGYQADLLRGGIHFGYFRWQYRIHQVGLVTIPQGKIGYVYARDGDPLQASQTLARAVQSNNFQDARAFFGDEHSKDEVTLGQRGRQRAIVREGAYAINLALFIV